MYFLIMHVCSSSKIAACSKSESESVLYFTAKDRDFLGRVMSETVSKSAADYGIGNSTITDLKKRERRFVTTTECQCSHDRKKGDMPGE